MHDQKLKLKDIRVKLEDFLGSKKDPSYVYGIHSTDSDTIIDSINKLANCMLSDISRMESTKRTNDLDYDYIPIGYDTANYIRYYYGYFTSKGIIRKALYNMIIILNELNIDRIGILLSDISTNTVRRVLESFISDFNWVVCDYNYKNTAIILSKNRNSKI